jgi:signal transduction histidine kinase/DNA-binding response OmpR family regulator
MTPTTKTTTNEPIDLFAAFDLAVFERKKKKLFEPVGRIPEWLPVEAGPIDLADRFPLLEMFLAELRDSGVTGPLRSDLWSEPDGQGGELYLEAIGVVSEGRRFVAIRSLPQERFTYQQLAHDFELEKQKVERLGRELEIKRQEAERATQAKSDFLASMSHEIRTPLNAIIGMADVLSLTSLTPDQQKYVETFQRNGVSLLNLINEILDLSKVEAGHVHMEAVDFDLGDVLARAMEVVELRVSAKGLWLRQSIAPDVPRCLIGDPHRLRQILVNLLGNSIKFTERGGLEIKVEPDPENPAPGRLRFAVADTGIGIPADKLGVIFESFGQADSSTTRRYGGTGLGLTISKHLVELMGGHIRVESAVGVGSTFLFTAGFGVQEVQAANMAKTASAASAVPVQDVPEGLRILLVDDSDDNRLLFVAYLKRTNSSIDIAENGQIAVDLFRERRYDLVLMDVEMPVMDGYQAVSEIRRIETETGAEPTPVLALTAHAFSDMSGKGFAAGFTDLLTKPIRHATLLEAVAKYASAPIEVQIEEDMADVVPAYLAKRRAEVAVYRRALEAGDFDTIKNLAHKMKGTGMGYGFPKLTEFGTRLEDAALQQDAQGIAGPLGEFARFVAKVQLK